MLQNSVTRCRSEEGTGKHRNAEFQGCVGRRCREFRTRYQHGRSHADNRCPSMWTETASCETEPVLTPARWRWTPTGSRTKTDKDTHLRVASSLATVTIRRRLRYIRTRRTLWKLTGRSWTNPSRCQQELNPQIQEGTQRRRWSTDCRLRTNVEQLCAIIMRINEMFKETNYVNTNDQQWYGVVPDSRDVRKTRTRYMSVSEHTEFQCLDGGTRAKDQWTSCECSNCVHHSRKSRHSQTRD